MLAAVSACGEGRKVTVIERNPYMGKKLNITGKGRCNLTNDCTVQEYLENVVTNPKFLLKAAYRFPPAKVMEFFTEAGVPLKTERGRRVFPQSDRAADITECLCRLMSERGADVIRGKAAAIETAEGRVCGVRIETKDGVRSAEADAVILCAGGMSYPGTGSDGSGYALARALGHSIVPPRASLVPLVTRESWPRELTGLSLKNVNVSFADESGVLFSEQGEMLFTHFGVSGPLVLSGSAHIKSFPCNMFIDMKPALDAETLDARILSDFGEFKNRHFINALTKLLPKAMIPCVAALSGIDAESALQKATEKFISRFSSMENAILQAGKRFQDLTLSEMDVYWEGSKKHPQ